MKDLGFDFAYNYKKVILDDVLKKSAPDGIDCFFDNVSKFTSMRMKITYEKIILYTKQGSIDRNEIILILI